MLRKLLELFCAVLCCVPENMANYDSFVLCVNNISTSEELSTRYENENLKITLFKYLTMFQCRQKYLGNQKLVGLKRIQNTKQERLLYIVKRKLIIVNYL